MDMYGCAVCLESGIDSLKGCNVPGTVLMEITEQSISRAYNSKGHKGIEAFPSSGPLSVSHVILEVLILLVRCGHHVVPNFYFLGLLFSALSVRENSCCRAVC
eukprot:2347914-Amphidinium_carterae.1